MSIFENFKQLLVGFDDHKTHLLPQLLLLFNSEIELQYVTANKNTGARYFQGYRVSLNKTRHLDVSFLWMRFKFCSSDICLHKCMSKLWIVESIVFLFSC